MLWCPRSCVQKAILLKGSDMNKGVSYSLLKVCDHLCQVRVNCKPFTYATMKVKRAFNIV